MADGECFLAATGDQNRLNVKTIQDIAGKLKILRQAKSCGNTAETCRYFRIARQTFYLWKTAFECNGKQSLINNKPCPEDPALRVPRDIEEQIIHLRTRYHAEPEKIAWYIAPVLE